MQKRASLFLLGTLGAVFLFPSLGCRSNAPRYNEVMRSYVGEPLATVVERKGVPDARFTHKDGTAVYEWNSRRWATNFITGARYEAYCNTRVTVDEEDIVLSFSWDGNDCK